jgi:serine/threonine protein phosphatase 1
MYTYVIGDVHGMLSKLRRLLRKIPFKPDRDRLAFVGDYVDRGPDSKGVLDCILDLMERGWEVICLRGNHEWMWQNYLKGDDPLMFLVNGGEETLKSYETEGQGGGDIVVPARHLEFLEGLLPYHEMEDFILVHGGLRPGVPLVEQDEQDLYWIRFEFIFSAHDFGKCVVFGHTPFQRPFVGRHCIGIDTGAVYGNKLTCVRLPDVKFYSV